MADLKKGTRIGPYRIIAPCASSKDGMVHVYQAMLGDDARVALKISRDERRGSRSNYALEQEVDILKSLNHPGVVRVLPAGTQQEVFLARAVEVSGKPWYYVMEYLAGGSLKDLFGGLGILPFPLTCTIVLHLIEALHYLHQQGIAHLDIRPENVLFRYRTENGAPIAPALIDFSVAARVKSIRLSGGSLHTVAPEQLRQARGELSPEIPLDMARIDIYSLGVVTYRLWTGSYPFGGVTAEGLSNAVLNSTPQTPTLVNVQLPETVDILMHRWLSKDPARRPGLDELHQYFSNWSEGMTDFPDLYRTRPIGKGWFFRKQ